MPSIRTLAYYLPQFHPIPENDRWWGKGFTEWTNTAKATALFRGHYQPHVPADLGFYDLRVPETREAQAQLARESGVSAFCYYHYWFAGVQLLERPLAEVVGSGEPNFPFCVCWANQTWTGVWHGAPHRVLIEQTYPGEHDHRAHFESLLPAFSDRRYVTVNGKPVFVIYRPTELPEPERTTDLWRKMAIDAGLRGLYLIGVTQNPNWDARGAGFDSANYWRLPPRNQDVPFSPTPWHLRRRIDQWRKRPTIYRYEDVIDILSPPASAGRMHPTALHAWDNSPRSGSNGLVLQDSRPELFRTVLRRALETEAPHPAGEQLVFLKSWNEWAEGNHLEPDLRFGRAYLEVVRSEMERAGAVVSRDLLQTNTENRIQSVA